MFLVNKEAMTGTWPGKGLSLKEERQTHKGATLLDDRVDDIYIIIFASSSIIVTISSNTILFNKRSGSMYKCDGLKYKFLEVGGKVS